ncbi:MAG: AAA family ATPase [Actinomycetota bacterium]|nr:AAA family ATPase [Actinomycetota bacterium]
MAIEPPTTLLERERELSEFRGALSEAQEGRGRVVLVEAPAGLGKTSLLRAAFEAAAEAGFVCLRARASDLERDFAYGCVRQLLEPAIAKVSKVPRDRLFEGAAALSTPLFAPTGAALPSSVDSSFAMLHGLYWLLNNLADESPVALSVDDLHWSDTESLRFLNYLAPRMDGLPLAVLASTRPGEGDTGELARLAAAPETVVMRPRPLSTDATSRLCEHRLGSAVAPEFADACREATGGNPFFLEALLRETIEQRFATDARGADRVRGIGPAAVAQAVLLRLSGKPPAATALVRAVAILGDGASLAEAARLADLTEQEAASASDLLITHGLLQPAAGLEFAHPIVREAVYADIGSHERAEAHARAAGILSASGASEERIAAQIAEAEPTGDPERVELLRRVAVDALGRGAPATAVAWLGRALAEPPPPASRAEVLLELGAAELRLATPAAVDHLTGAAELAPEPRLLAMSVRLLANTLTMLGNADGAVEAIESAIGVVEPVDRELALLLEAELAAHSQQASLERRAPAATRLERYADLDGTTPGERLVLASLAFERARASDSASEAAAHIERALAGGRLLSEQELDVAGPFYLLVVGLYATDAVDLAAQCLDQALADAQASASIPAQAFLMAHRGRIAMHRGAVAQAEADARTALELLTVHDIWLGATLALGVLIEALVEGGEVEAAELALSSSGFAEEIPPGMASNRLLQARSLLRLAQGRTREGLDDLIEFGRRYELWGGAHPLASRWRSHASLALAAMGDSDAAGRMAAEDLERAWRWGAASGIGMALRANALVEGDAVSIDGLREAVGVLESSPARLEHARALVELGAALRRANRRAEARSALQDGLDFADRLGARALAERGRTELRAAGGRSSDPWGTGVEQLTASERRVAELAAQGHSNPEIAQSLFVTRKTIETHLGRVYRKLDISGRGQLAQTLDEQVPPAAG